MYVSIRVNSSAMNSYLEYMHGPTGTENRRIITIDALYRCCVMAGPTPGCTRDSPSCPRDHSRSDSRDGKITYTCTKSGTSNCGITFLWPPVTSINQNLDNCLWHTLWMKQQNLQSWKQYAYVYFFFSLTLLRICENEQFEFQTVTFKSSLISRFIETKSVLGRLLPSFYEDCSSYKWYSS